MRIAVGPVGGLDGRRITVTGFTMHESVVPIDPPANTYGS